MLLETPRLFSGAICESAFSCPTFGVQDKGVILALFVLMKQNRMSRRADERRISRVSSEQSCRTLRILPERNV
jgi:hypothetical protein